MIVIHNFIMPRARIADNWPNVAEICESFASNPSLRPSPQDTHMTASKILTALALLIAPPVAAQSLLTTPAGLNRDEPVLLGTDWCPHCESAGHQGVPVLLYKGKVWRGFSEETMLDMLTTK
jgi:thiol-disulfide isomerase/thioredoxin